MTKNKCYINGMGCISAQDTESGDFLGSPIDYSDAFDIRSLKIKNNPYLSPRESRRMSSGVKNSIVASYKALDEANLKELDAILVGSGLGCLRDTNKFLTDLIQNEEQYLNPTLFIQSSHNTVAGQIALQLKCYNYNFTYVNKATSFQSALLDALMAIENGERKNALVGGVDEITDYVLQIYQSIHFYKSPEFADAPVYGEAGTFFVLENEKKKNSYAEVVDIHFRNHLDKEDLERFTNDFLTKNNLTPEAIDIVILGNNPYVTCNHYYDKMEKIIPATPLYFKHLFGEFFTSNAIATWLGAMILKKQEIPTSLYKNESQKNKKTFQNIIIYNQFKGHDHSLTLLRNV